MLELNKIYNEDCLVGMKKLADNSIDAVVTDPPYGLGFMGKEWDIFDKQFINKDLIKDIIYRAVLSLNDNEKALINMRKFILKELKSDKL